MIKIMITNFFVYDYVLRCSDGTALTATPVPCQMAVVLLGMLRRR